MSHFDVTGGRRDLRHNHFEQCGFSRAVGTDDTDTFAPLDIKGDVGKECALLFPRAISLRNFEGLQGIISALGALLELNLHL